MNQISADLRRFAARLAELDSAGDEETRSDPILNVSEKLKGPLTVLMGQAGYRAFLARALALAGAEVAWLKAMHVTSSGALEGVVESKRQVSPADLSQGRLVLISQFLGLLSSFMGELILVQILRQAWPQLTSEDLNFRNEN